MKPFILALAFFLSAVSASAATVADSLYQAAIAMPDTASLGTRIQAFKQVVQVDPRYAPAHHQLALLYIRQATAETRQSAQFALDRALEIDPDNIDYQLTRGLLLHEQARFANARDQYKRILEKHPDCARAHYGIGDDSLDEYLRITSAVTGEQHFAKADYEDAEMQLQSCIAYDPKFRDAYYRLGLLYFQAEKSDSLILTMTRLLRQFPEDKNGLLYYALGYRGIGDWLKAGRLYAEAIKRMDVPEQLVMNDIEDLLTDADRQKEKNIPIQEMSAEQARFWRKQDPLLLTDYNERLLEHYSRVAYVNLRYSNPRLGIRGYETDQGKTYIRFGPPLKQAMESPQPGGQGLNVASKNDDDDTKTMRQNASAHQASPPGADGFFYHDPEKRIKDQLPQSVASFTVPEYRITWYYENFQVLFGTYTPRGKWRFTGKFLEEVIKDLDEGRPLVPSGGEVFRKQPQRFIDPYKQLKYQPPHQIAAFREGDHTRVELACALPKDRLNIQADAVNLIDGLFLFTPDWDPVTKDVREISRLSPLGTDSLRSAYLLSQRTFSIQPGDYVLDTEILDRTTNAIGAIRSAQTFAIADTGLAVSDLLLAADITPRKRFPESRSDLDIVPNPLRTYSHSEPVFLYLEVYNLDRDAYGRTRFNITYRVSPPEKNAVDPGLFIPLDVRNDTVTVFSLVKPDAKPNERPEIRVQYRLPKRNQIREALRQMNNISDRVATAVSAEYEGDRPDDFTFLQIDVRTLPEGIYKLTVAVTDRHTGAYINKETLFRIIQ